MLDHGKGRISNLRIKIIGLVSNEKLAEQAKINSMENFSFGFEEVFINTIIKRMDQNQELFTRIMDDKEFSNDVKIVLLKRVYERLKEVG